MRIAAARSGFVALLTGITLSFAALPAFAADPFAGTWVLNAAKSKGTPGTVPDSSTLVITELGGGKYKSVNDYRMAGFDVHAEVTFALDGKDYTVVQTPAQPGALQLVQTFERINERSVKITIKVGGQAMATVMEDVSPDGKTLTATMSGVGQQYAALSGVTVLDKK
jgi:hypothetical protein